MLSQGTLETFFILDTEYCTPLIPTPCFQNPESAPAIIETCFITHQTNNSKGDNSCQVFSLPKMAAKLWRSSQVVVCSRGQDGKMNGNWQLFNPFAYVDAYIKPVCLKMSWWNVRVTNKIFALVWPGSLHWHATEDLLQLLCGLSLVYACTLGVVIKQVYIVFMGRFTWYVLVSHT